MVSPNIVDAVGSKQNTMNLSFAGCGFLGIYHIGVASCIREYAPQLYIDKISGASAGAIAAAGLITECDLGSATTYVLKVAQKARARALGPLHPSFDLVKILREGLNYFLPDNCHEIATGRLHVSLTRVSDRKNVIVNEFESKADLIQALICSAFVPFYCGVLPPKYKGVRYVDGGLSDNIPQLDENTIIVSPFAGESDICPNDQSANDLHMFLVNTSIQFTMANFYRMAHALFPVPPEELSQMCRQGFDDALKYLQRKGLISCMKHLSIQSSIKTNSEAKDLKRMTSVSNFDGGFDLEPVGDEVDHDAMDHHPDTCSECKSRQHAALLDSLPPSVIGALQAASDSVNKGLLAPVYKNPAFKVLAIMAAPWFLPLETGIEMAKRVWEWAPYMPSDMQWFVTELARLLQQLLGYIQSNRHKYSARFSCQLDITEVDYRKKVYTSTESLPDTPLVQRKQASVTSRNQRNININFSVGYKARYKDPVDCVDQLRHHLIDEVDAGNVEEIVTDKENLDNATVESNSSESLNSDPAKVVVVRSRCNSVSSRSRCNSVSSIADDTAQQDTFDSCLQAANEVDSILSFYHTDEQNPQVVRVTEIFPVDEGSRRNSLEQKRSSVDEKSGDSHLPSESSSTSSQVESN